jgi:hypothetical protein
MEQYNISDDVATKTKVETATFFCNVDVALS